MNLLLEILYILESQINKVIKNNQFNTKKYYRELGLKRKNENRKELTAEQIKDYKSFWGKYIEEKAINTDYCRLYSDINGYFDVRFLPDDIYYDYIDPYFNDREEAKCFENKNLYEQFFGEIAQPVTLCKKINKIWFSKNHEIITLEKVLNILNGVDGVFIKKAKDSYGGHGVRFVDMKSTNENEIKEVLLSYDCDIIIQQEILQCTELNRLNQSSINTVRVLSVISDKGVKVYSCLLRMGINGSKVDNISSGGIVCGITESGRLKKYAYSDDSKRYEIHPNSGISFEEIRIPKFDLIVNQVKELHKKMPLFRMISWDFAIDKDENIVLVESNLSAGGLNLHQYNNGPLFGNDTTKILNEVFGKNE